MPNASGSGTGPRSTSPPSVLAPRHVACPTVPKNAVGASVLGVACAGQAGFSEHRRLVLRRIGARWRDSCPETDYRIWDVRRVCVPHSGAGVEPVEMRVHLLLDSSEDEERVPGRSRRTLANSPTEIES